MMSSGANLYKGLTIEEMEDMGQSKEAILQRALAILNSQEVSDEEDGENQTHLINTPIKVFQPTQIECHPNMARDMKQKLELNRFVKFLQIHAKIIHPESDP